MSTPTENAPRAPTSISRPGRILVVDDEPGVRFTLGEFIRLAGHECHMAGGVSDALKLLEKMRFDVVISDIILPDAYGTDFLKTVRESYPETEVIMITGAPDAETAIDSLRGRAFDYLSKPVTRKRILNSLDNALQLTALRESNRLLEDRNRQYRENLEDLVSKRTAELSLLSRRLMNVQESERDALSREIHDELGQSLIALKLNLQHLQQQLAPGEELNTEYGRVLDFLDSIIESCRRMAHRLSPLVLERLGFAKAIERLVENLARSSTTTQYHLALSLGGLSENSERDANLYRIVQEALANSVKHAQAQEVHVEARFHSGVLRVRIQDDGKGFDSKQMPQGSGESGGMGLIVMRERAALAGGTVSVRSEPEGGTVIEVTVPIG